MTRISAMAVDVGVTTGFAIVGDDNHVYKSGNIVHGLEVDLTEYLYSIAMRFGPNILLIEYPVLNRINPNYAQLNSVYAATDEFIMNFKEAQTWGLKVHELTPSNWKIPPVMKLDLSQLNGENQDYKLTNHQKDAIRMCYYWFNWSTKNATNI